MIQICREAGPGETFMEDAPDAILVSETPFAVWPDERLCHNNNELETWWFVIHIPSGRVIGEVAWSTESSAADSVESWWNTLEGDMRQLCRVATYYSLGIECWDAFRPLLAQADFELDWDE